MTVVAAVAFGQAFACTPTRVWDGDGPIWCSEGPKVRLAGIAAREIDGECRAHQPCPRASGVAARDLLVQLLGGARGRSAQGHVLVRAPALRCRSRGSDTYGRTVASCAANGRDLACALVTAKVAVRWSRYSGREVCRADRGAIGDSRPRRG